MPPWQLGATKVLMKAGFSRYLHNALRTALARRRGRQREAIAHFVALWRVHRAQERYPALVARARADTRLQANLARVTARMEETGMSREEAIAAIAAEKTGALVAEEEAYRDAHLKPVLAAYEAVMGRLLAINAELGAEMDAHAEDMWRVGVIESSLGALAAESEGGDGAGVLAADDLPRRPLDEHLLTAMAEQRVETAMARAEIVSVVGRFRANVRSAALEAAASEALDRVGAVADRLRASVLAARRSRVSAMADFGAEVASVRAAREAVVAAAIMNGDNVGE